jgi:hypothetical protein
MGELGTLKHTDTHHNVRGRKKKRKFKGSPKEKIAMGSTWIPMTLIKKTTKFDTTSSTIIMIGQTKKKKNKKE